MTTVTLRPLRDLLVVRLRPQATKIGSLHRVGPGEIAQWADVLRVGPEVRDIREGMGVLINPLAGHEIRDEIMLPESSVLATE